MKKLDFNFDNIFGECEEELKAFREMTEEEKIEFLNAKKFKYKTSALLIINERTCYHDGTIVYIDGEPYQVRSRYKVCTSSSDKYAYELKKIEKMSEKLRNQYESSKRGYVSFTGIPKKDILKFIKKNVYEFYTGQIIFIDNKTYKISISRSYKDIKLVLPRVKPIYENPKVKEDELKNKEKEIEELRNKWEKLFSFIYDLNTSEIDINVLKLINKPEHDPNYIRTCAKIDTLSLILAKMNALEYKDNEIFKNSLAKYNKEI